jgi:hypothetical protein
MIHRIGSLRGTEGPWGARHYCGLALAFVVASCLAGAPANAAQTSDNIPRALQAIGHSTEWVQSRFGKPDHVQASRLCCNFSGYDPTETVSQSYELEDGGILGFVYEKPIGGDEWVAVGVVYDALQSVQRQTIESIFRNGDLRQKRVFACYDKDFGHYVEGMPLTDGWPYVLAAFGGWLAADGRLVYIKYLVGKPPTKYDAISGQNVLAAISTTDLDRRPVVQFGYFQSPRHIMDLHSIPDDDFSIATAYKKCF